MGAAAPIALGATAIGGVMNAAGSLQQGAAESAAAQFNAERATRNAYFAGLQMDWENQNAAEALQDVGRQESATIGAGRSAFAAGNVKVGEGTAFTWEQSVRKMANEDRARVTENLSRRRLALEQEQSDYLDEASLLRARAKSAKTSGRIGALASMLGTGGRFASMYTQMYPSM